MHWHDLEHGLWTTAMDFQNVQTLSETPYGPPEGSVRHDGAGLYGRVPMPFPMKDHLAGGLWSPRPAPALPSRIRLLVEQRAEGGLKSFSVRARGPPQPRGHMKGNLKRPIGSSTVAFSCSEIEAGAWKAQVCPGFARFRWVRG